MTNVYEINNQEDVFVTKIKKELLSCDNGNNSDMQILFQGYLHNKIGFKLKVENVEVFSDNLMQSWKSVIESQKMHADITADLANAWVQITCRRITRHRTNIRDMFSNTKISKMPFTLMLYICFLVTLIITIWQRHKEKFQK